MEIQLTDKQKRWRDENIPNLHNGSYRRKYTKAMAEKKLRAAVDSKCLDCACWQKTEITNCQVPCCPLFNVRPYQHV